MASIARRPSILGSFPRVSRVTGYNRDPGKHWYVVTKLVFGLRLKMNVVTSTDNQAIVLLCRRLSFMLDCLGSESVRKTGWLAPQNLALLWKR